MDEKIIREIVQSSNLNFLIGAGASRPFLPVLNDIETKLNAETTETKKIPIYKEYLRSVMLPNKKIVGGTVDRSNGSNFRKTFDQYKDFFLLIAQILLKRESTILSKQANIFTTNIDVLMETALEESNLDYSDGFTGELNPTFNLSNFKRSISKRSLHFENISEIPVFNLIKLHGSLTWKKYDEGIMFSKLAHFNNGLLKKNDGDFLKGYKELLVVNPENKKLEETVLNVTYHELLRMYSSELEKENSVLFIIGFSMADQHIQQLTLTAANSNPTLKIYFFAHSKGGVQEASRRLSLDKLKYSNITIVEPIDDAAVNRLSLGKISETFFEKIIPEGNGNNENHAAQE